MESMSFEDGGESMSDDMENLVMEEDLESCCPIALLSYLFIN